MAACGTYAGYTGGCRCDGCRAAMAAYHRRYRAGIRSPRPAKPPQVKPKPVALLHAITLGDWVDDAACAGDAGKGIDWFPSLSGASRSRIDDAVVARARRKAARALAVCAACPVRDRCLEAAMAVPPMNDFGVWGGTVDVERYLMRRRQRAAA